MAGPVVFGATADVGPAGSLFPLATAVLDALGRIPDVPPCPRRPALPPALGFAQAGKTPLLAAPADIPSTSRTRDIGRYVGKSGLPCSGGAENPGKHRTPRGASFARTAEPLRTGLVEHAEAAGPPPGDRHRPVVRGRCTHEQLARVRPRGPPTCSGHRLVFTRATRSRRDTAPAGHADTTTAADLTRHQ